MLDVAKEATLRAAAIELVKAASGDEPITTKNRCAIRLDVAAALRDTAGCRLPEAVAATDWAIRCIRTSTNL